MSARLPCQQICAFTTSAIAFHVIFVIRVVLLRSWRSSSSCCWCCCCMIWTEQLTALTSSHSMLHTTTHWSYSHSHPWYLSCICWLLYFRYAKQHRLTHQYFHKFSQNHTFILLYININQSVCSLDIPKMWVWTSSSLFCVLFCAVLLLSPAPLTKSHLVLGYC